METNFDLDFDSLLNNKKTTPFPSELYNINFALEDFTRNNSGRKNTTLFLDTFSIISLTNDTSDLQQLNADFIVIDFWFLKCPGCIKAIPDINRLYTKSQNEKFMVIGLNPIDTNIRALHNFSQKAEIKYPVYTCSYHLANKFKVQSYPTYILLDNRKGKKGSYYSFKDIEELQAKLPQIIN